jgi:hypothetical protein
MRRRRFDWIQFSILLVSILLAWWSVAKTQGEIQATLEDLKQNVSHLEQRIDELQSRKGP